MSAAGSPGDDDRDSIDRLSRALDDTNAKLARAHAAHEAVRERLGDRAPPPSDLPRAVAKPDVGSGAYRGKDPQAELQRALDEAKTALASLRAETSRLEGECDMKFPDPPFAETPFGIAVILIVSTAVVGGLVWVLQEYGSKQAGKALGGVVLFLLLVRRVFREKPSDER